MEFTVKNNGESTIYSPVLLFNLYNSDHSIVNGVEQKAQVRDTVELGSYIRSSDTVTKQINILL